MNAVRHAFVLASVENDLLLVQARSVEWGRLHPAQGAASASIPMLVHGDEAEGRPASGASWMSA